MVCLGKAQLPEDYPGDDKLSRKARMINTDDEKDRTSDGEACSHGKPSSEEEDHDAMQEFWLRAQLKQWSLPNVIVQATLHWSINGEQRHETKDCIVHSDNLRAYEKDSGKTKPVPPAL